MSIAPTQYESTIDMSPDEFLSWVSPMLEFEVKRKIEISPDASWLTKEELLEDYKKALEKEKGFCKVVVAAYEKWSVEPEPLVLWDIDDTLGKYFPVVAEDGGEVLEWKLRPSLPFLLPYLRGNFPTIRNGLLSNRIDLNTQLEMPDQLGSIADFFDTSHLYSCRGQAPSPVVKAHFREIGVYPDGDHERKLTIVWNLRDRGLNVKVIDDNRVAKTLGEDGVFTFYVAPIV